MKKLLRIMILVIILLNYTARIGIAQCLSGTWCTAGNIVVGTEILGGTSASTGNLNIRNDAAYNINFHTNGSQRMTILSSGNVGIGTSSPGQLLNVSNGGAAPQLRLTSGTGIYSEFLATNNGDLVITPTGGSSNNVGIGGLTSAPLSKLEVLEGAGNPQLRLSYNQSGTNTVFETNLNGHLRIASTSGTHGINVNPANTVNLEIKTITGVTEQLRLTNGAAYTSLILSSTGNLNIIPTGGKVAINTSSTPLQTLDVNGTADIQIVNQDNSLTQVLVRDPSSSGLIKWRDASTLGPVSLCNTTSTNYVPFFSPNATTLCNSQIYNGSTYVSVNTTSNLGARLNVINTGSGSYGGWFQAAAVGLYGLANGVSGIQKGLFGEATGTASGTNDRNAGVHGHGKNATTDYGVYGLGELGDHVFGGHFEGIGISNTNTDATGVYGTASGAAVNYGVYGTAGPGDWAVYANGKAGGTTLWITSDGELKIGVEDLTNAMSIINQLKPKTYYFDTTQYSFMNLPSSLQYGLISQDVENVCPNLVHSFKYPEHIDTSGNVINEALDVKYMNYTGYIPVMIEALKEQQATIQSLQDQINGCCGLRSSSGGNDASSGQTIELRSSQLPSLGQSVPNPHAMQTTIPYYIPAESGTAQIIFTDELGRTVNTVEIISKGKGQLTILTSQLEDGIYNYSLVIDGELISTRKMVKSAY